MVIKSQQDIKNANREKSNRVPKSMENKFKQPPQDVAQPSNQPPKSATKELTDLERIERIEAYLTKADAAFETIANELTSLKILIQSLNGEISKITGDVIRLTQLEENRYIEIVSVLNQTNEKVKTLDEYLPAYIDNRLEEYFADPALDEMELLQQEQGVDDKEQNTKET